MTIWGEIQTEQVLNERINSTKQDNKIYYPGTILLVNNEEIPLSLVGINNKYHWVQSSLIVIQEDKIHIPLYIYNQYFK